ncbi:unnamed protein product [Caenorhabditis angaria]|uniref:DAGKc domain-containing protein n=1 Tax=Caenorhabditis angaria TaxID=860376 RepID=A0A9P1I8U3_9PELO|nr:unnamed protein product [Caenorhabditis angaria]
MLFTFFIAIFLFLLAWKILYIQRNAQKRQHTQVCTLMGNALCCCCHKSNEEQNAQLTDVILSRQPPVSENTRGNLLVFINPHSGRGKSLETFVNTVAPRLDKNSIRYEVVITTGPNHAKTYLSTKKDLGKFNGIVILSGDGLVFEALNGLMLRDDAFQMFPSLPIGVIPSGSGNGLLSSILAKYKESLEPKNVMTKAIEFVTSPSAKAEAVALLQIKTDTADLVGFLSIGWGLMADIDIESERWRKSLGAHRFTASGFIRSACK